MVWDAISGFFLALFHLAVDIVASAVRFVVTLLGPGLTAFLVAVAAALWYFGWI